jgi:hypothetical protein
VGPDQPPALKPTKPGLRKKLWIAGFFLALPVLPLLILHVHGKWALTRLKKQLVLQGEKLTISENEPARQTDGVNRFRELTRALALLRSTDVFHTLPPAGKQTAPGKLVSLRWLNDWPIYGRTNGDWHVLEGTLASSSNAMAEVRALLREPVLEARLDYRQGWNLLLPHLPPLKSFGQCLGGAASHALHAGQLDAAKDCIKDLLATAQILEKEPVVVSQLVRVALVALAVTSTWQALEWPGWTDTQLLELQRAFQAVQLLPSLVDALEMERASTVEIFASMRRSGDTVTSYLGMNSPTSANTNQDLLGRMVTRTIVIPIWQWSFSYEDERYYLQTMQTLLQVARTCAQDRSAAPTRQAKAQLEEINEQSGFARVRHFLSFSFAVGLSRALEKGLNAETQKELTIAAIGVRRYALKHGAPPATLEGLVPEWVERVPRDYWGNGGPLLYRTNASTPAAVLLYSTGPDGVDSGGDPSGVKTKSPPLFSGHDMVWPTAVTEEELPEALKVLKCNILKKSGSP